MSKIANIVKNPSVIGQYISGVIEEATSGKNVYQLAFVKEEEEVGTSTFLHGQAHTPTSLWWQAQTFFSTSS